MKWKIRGSLREMAPNSSKMSRFLNVHMSVVKLETRFWVPYELNEDFV